MSDTDKKAIARNFSAAAETYNQYASAQETIALNLTALIKKYVPKNFSKIADLGCGTGFLSKQLKKLFPESPMYCVDIADGMLHACQNLLCSKDAPAPVFIKADIETVSLPAVVDLAASNYALQWTGRTRALHNICNNLNDNGMVALAVPVAGSFNELHTAYRNVCTYDLASYPTISDYCDDVTSEGMKITYQEESDYVCRFDCALDALRSLKRIGANFSGHASHKQLPPGKTIKLIHEYEKLSRKTGVTLTYRTLYLIAQKA